MENTSENNNKTIIGILIGIVIMLVVVLVLFVTGTISFSNKENNTPDIDNNETETTKTIKIDKMKEYVYDANYQADVKYQEYGKYQSNGDIRTREGFNTYVIKNGQSYFKDLKVPYINIDTQAAKNINEELKKLYDGYVEKYNTYASNYNDGSYLNSSNVPFGYIVLTYYTYQYNNVLSVVVSHGVQGTAEIYPEYITYSFDLTDGSLLDYDTFLDKFNLTRSGAYSKAEGKILSYTNTTELKKSEANEESNISQTKTNFKNNITNDKVIYFIDNQGNINYIVKIYMNAGNGYDYRIVTLDK